MSDFLTIDIQGFKADLPILPLPSGVNIAFFNLHGAVDLTEHCGKKLAAYLGDCDVLITAESKGFATLPRLRERTRAQILRRREKV